MTTVAAWANSNGAGSTNPSVSGTPATGSGGYTSGHAPKLEVWRAKTRGGVYDKIVDSSAFNTYNVTGAGVNASYWRMGCYKYNGSKWNSAAISQILSKLAFKKGANLYSEAVAYLAGL